MKYVIISNRLPVTVVSGGDKLSIARSGGGLATGLDSLETKAEKHWIGWAGMYVEDEDKKRKICAKLKKQLLHPVFLDPEQIQDYYEGYSNATLWPLCHYFFSYISHNENYWKAYREVNALFCEQALEILEPGDMVWVHDYQLMLLPAMIRERMPEVSIGYFHHIPFPSYELFRCLPERAEILRGLLGADLIAFHIHDYARHFISTLYRVLGLECHMDEVQLENRAARIEAFPMGINYELYRNAMDLPETRAFAEELKQIAGDSKIILSVDRLDYSKGILFRLAAFSSFLQDNPEFRGQVTLLMVVAPSRDNVEKYAALKTEIDQAIGAINGAYTSVGWIPVHYFYRSFSFSELAAMYNMADIALVTPLRDGMNLVAKEYLAAKRDRPGVLILSEMAGAAVELAEAVIVNPTNIREMSEGIRKAVTMPEEEQMSALRTMQALVARNDVYRWAGNFIEELHRTKSRNDELYAKVLEKSGLRHIADVYSVAARRLLVLDYDGTLIPFSRKPELAMPTREVREILACLAQDERNKVVICSGRDKDTLESWLGDLDIGLSAEHGVFHRENGEWRGSIPDVGWHDEILEILERIKDRTPRSRIEEKKTALVWHYRQVDPWLASLRASQLLGALVTPCSRLGLQVMRGDKIVEIKLAEYNKGTEIKRLLDAGPYDFVMAMGDDTTDEDMFRALPPEAVTIKVGSFSDAARYTIPTQSLVLPFLRILRGGTNTSKFAG